MPKVFFTQNLQCHLESPCGTYAGTTIKETLNDVFRKESVLRGHVVDEQGRLRQHVLVFIDGQPLRDRLLMSDPVGAQSEVWVMQASPGA